MNKEDKDILRSILREAAKDLKENYDYVYAYGIFKNGIKLLLKEKTHVCPKVKR